MKRCNNCGWFNLDSAERCEKCDEESFKPVIPEVNEEDPQPQEIVQPISEPEPTPVQEPVSLPVQEPEVEPARKSPVMATVAFGSAEPVSQLPRKALAATVMDASAVLREEMEVHCPKCRYPIIGYVEYCPNCGATVRAGSDNSAQQVSKATKIESCEDVPASSPSSSALKATVRDIPEALIAEEKDVYKLVPVDALGEAAYEMQIGDILVIGGRRYKFQK